MTQYSFFWGCGISGDQGNVTLDKMRWAQMLLGNSTPDESGVVYWNQAITPPAFDTGVSFSGPVDGLLEPSNPSGSIVRVASGVGMVQGSIYFNDANIGFDISSDLGAASATDLIVLERSASSSEVRIVRVKGLAGSTATVTQTTATWQVPIAQVVLTAGGDFSSLIDIRELVSSPSGGRVKIESKKVDSAVTTLTFSNIPPLFNQLVVLGSAKSSGSFGNIDTLIFTLNGDSTASYDVLNLSHDGTSITTTSSIAATAGILGQLANSDGTLSAADFGTFEATIFNARDTLAYKNVSSESNTTFSATSGTPGNKDYTNWKKAEKVNSIELQFGFGDFVAGSEIFLYGIH